MFSINGLLEGGYEGKTGDCRVGDKALPKNKFKSHGPSLPLFQRRLSGSRAHPLGQEASSCPAFREKNSFQGPY